MQPQRIARFVVVEPLGAGAMGVVYRARDPLLGREVALKLIRAELSGDERSRSRFLRECRASASINHPGIATIYEAGEAEGGQLYLASELIHGETLQARLGRGALSPAGVLELGIQLGQALAAAHARDVVHRDIKPANLMLEPDGRLKILDFGLARLHAPDAAPDETATRTRAGAVVGTPAYMSPEQATGSPVDARTDLFSAGCVLYAAVSAREPFLGASVPETLRRILAEEPAPLESLDPAIPVALRRVIRKALAKRPEDRFASATDFVVALEAARAELAAGSAVRARRRARRSGPRLAAALGLAATLVALAAFALFRAGRANPLGFASRDKLLIADVDNRTGEEAFDLALRTALEADLDQSRHVSVFGAGQVTDTLKLMRRDAGTRVDEALGRDLCRFAGVRALLLPRILGAGDAYELHAILVDPHTGRHVDRVRVAARSREEVLLHAIDELSREVRGRLGESLEAIARADQPVTDVTTSSWEALSYLSLGQLKWQQNKIGEAATLFEQALDKDPHFVAAKGSLGLALIQFLGQPERGRQLLREALGESGDLPERERLMTRAVNRQFVDMDPEGALEEYALISELYPDLMQPFNNRGRILMQLGRYDAAERMFEEAALRDPRHSVPLQNLWFLRQQYARDSAGGEAAGRRLVELGPDVADFHNMLGWSLVCQRRFDDALAELRRALDLDPVHVYALPNCARLLHVTGAPGEALPLYRRWLDRRSVGGGDARTDLVRDMALACRAAGRDEEAQQLLEAERDRLASAPEPPTVTALLHLSQLEALLGRTESARRLIERASRSSVSSSSDEATLAIALALLGERDAALDALSRALAAGYEPCTLSTLPALEGLSGDPRLQAALDGRPSGS